MLYVCRSCGQSAPKPETCQGCARAYCSRCAGTVLRMGRTCDACNQRDAAGA